MSFSHSKLEEMNRPLLATGEPTIFCLSGSTADEDTPTSMSVSSLFIDVAIDITAVADSTRGCSSVSYFFSPLVVSAFNLSCTCHLSLNRISPNPIRSVCQMIFLPLRYYSVLRSYQTDAVRPFADVYACARHELINGLTVFRDTMTVRNLLKFANVYPTQLHDWQSGCQ